MAPWHQCGKLVCRARSRIYLESALVAETAGSLCPSVASCKDRQPDASIRQGVRMYHVARRGEEKLRGRETKRGEERKKRAGVAAVPAVAEAAGKKSTDGMGMGMECMAGLLEHIAWLEPVFWSKKR